MLPASLKARLLRWNYGFDTWRTVIKSREINS